MIRKYWCYFWTAFITVAGFPIVMILMPLTFSTRLSMLFVRKVWANVLLWAGGVKAEAYGTEHCDEKRPTIYVVNHQSTLDIPMLFVHLPIEFRFVSKKALKYVPFLGWFMTASGFVFIDRSNRRAAVRSLDEAGEKIRKGTSIVMFPEGTRSDDGSVLPFKKGPFALAMKAGVPICPVAIEGTDKIMPKNSWMVVPGAAKIKVGAPIDPKVFGRDREGLMKAVRNRIIDLQLELGGKGGDRENAVAPTSPQTAEADA